MNKAIERAVQSIKGGGMVLLMDEKSREGEGDLVISAEKCGIEDLKFMILKGMGIICLAIDPVILKRLKIPLMVRNNTDKFKTGFTVSVDYKYGTTTGVSLYDRLKTIKAIIDENSMPSDFTRPGHIFPLRGHPLGLKARSGHTESSLHLMKLAGLTGAAVICEILNDNGMSADTAECQEFAEKYNIPLINIIDLK